MVSNPTDVTPDAARIAETAAMVGALRLATVWIDLKPERVQDSVVADAATTTVSLGLAIDQPQTVLFALSGPGLAVTFGNPIGNPAGNSVGNPINSGTAARAA
jgi:hypothetical protein